MLHRGVVVIITAQHHSAKLEPRLCVGLSPVCSVSKICDVENLWQWSGLEISPNAFRRSSNSPFIIINFISLILGRGVPFTIQERTNDLPRISHTDLPVTSEAKNLYKQTYNGLLADEPHHGLDPVSVYDVLIQQKSDLFKTK